MKMNHPYSWIGLVLSIFFQVLAIVLLKREARKCPLRIIFPSVMFLCMVGICLMFLSVELFAKEINGGSYVSTRLVCAAGVIGFILSVGIYRLAAIWVAPQLNLKLVLISYFHCFLG